MDKAFRLVDGKVKEVEVAGCFLCGNTSGRFRVRLSDGKKVCVNRCNGPVQVRDAAKTTFPFTTTHFDGKAVEVTSMRHLRKLESAHGVHCAAYNFNSNNWDR